MKLFGFFRPIYPRAECHTYRICELRKILTSKCTAIFKPETPRLLCISVLSPILSLHLPVSP